MIRVTYDLGDKLRIMRFPSNLAENGGGEQTCFKRYTSSLPPRTPLLLYTCLNDQLP